jgi:ATP-binding cassette, subfamily B, bacterial
MTDRVRAARLLVVFPFRADPWRSALSVAIMVASGLAGVGLAFALKVITDAVVAGKTGQAIAGVILLVAMRLLVIGGSWTTFLLQAGIIDRTALFLDAELARLSADAVGIEHVERPDYLDRVEHLRQFRANLIMVPATLATTLATVVRIGITLYILAEVSPVLALLPLAAAPVLLATYWSNRSLSRLWDEKVGKLFRLEDALRRLPGTEPGGRELRVYGLKRHYQQRHRDVLDDSASTWGRVSLGGAAAEAIGWMVFGAAFIGALVLIGDRAVAGHLSAGDLVLVVTLASQLNMHLSNIAGVANTVGGSLRTAERLVWLTDYATGDQARSGAGRRLPPITLTEGIRLSGVGFSYPGTGQTVLSEVDLLLPAGATVAIVGDNGAGKSTLVKLLLRMYEPSTGEILVDGIPLRELEATEWRRRTSSGFQDFARFEFVARQAVGVGRLEQIDDDQAVLAALERAQASDILGSLPDGLSSQVGRNFADGVELSGGQWQKLALGRTMMRTDPLLLVLDEPTAALDAASEAKLFDSFSASAERSSRRSGAVTVVVSHRFSTVRTADLIVVIGEGGVLELGSHEELMAHGGTYAELFNLQARAYG